MPDGSLTGQLLEELYQGARTHPWVATIAFSLLFYSFAGGLRSCFGLAGPTESRVREICRQEMKIGTGGNNPHA